MPIETTWLVNQRVLLHRVHRQPRLVEIEVTNQLINALMNVGKPPVHSIVDRRGSTFIPPGAPFVRKTMTMMRHPNRGWLLLVAPPHPILDLIVYTVAKTQDVTFTRVDTMDIALSFLATQDPTLPDLRPYRDRFC